MTTNADTNYHTLLGRHSPGQGKQQDLTFAALKVGQRVAVQGEHPNDTTLLAKRVHIPKP